MHLLVLLTSVSSMKLIAVEFVISIKYIIMLC